MEQNKYQYDIRAVLYKSYMEYLGIMGGIAGTISLFLHPDADSLAPSVIAVIVGGACYFIGSCVDPRVTVGSNKVEQTLENKLSEPNK